MPHDPQAPHKNHTKLWLALAAALVLIALIVVPPYIGLNHYKTRVTQSVAAALGRPVRLADVELRLLPRPGFLLTDLTVEPDPDFGAEPVLHANTVTASIRFSSLWQGKLQISRISVDDASFNLARSADGRWNLESLFRSTSASNGSAATLQQPPYLEATNSRINIKNGVEKLPFSLLDADASMWRESNGDWRVRLRGQPARTDVTLDLADTGVLRLEATVHPAPQLMEMPLHVDLDWREAQLGQLTRLLLASDEGWRGDLTGELHLDGTAASAKVESRLRATGVHRAEFAPATPMDFDATCAFTLHYTQRSLDGLDCSSPVGDGRAHITGAVPGMGQSPKFTVELDRIPAQAALDLLRTMRNTIDPSLQATGSLSGHMTYDPAAVSEAAAAPAPVKKVRGRPSRAPQQVPGPLKGAFTVNGLKISGDVLSKPIQAATMTLEPAPEEPGEPSAWAASMAIPAGGPAPLTVTARLALSGFRMGVHGTAAIPRLREFARVLGASADPALAELAGEPATLDFTVEGPWVAPVDVRLIPAGVGPVQAIRTSGAITLHEANWKAPFLANAVLISSATLHLDNNAQSTSSAKGAMSGSTVLRWDPVEFSYGPVKGTATLEIPPECDDPQTCLPRFTLRFGALDAAAAQAALLGAREKGTLLSTLLARLTPSSPPVWPQMQGIVTADSLALGPVTLTGVTTHIEVKTTGAEATSFDAGMLGGHLHGTATLAAGDKPDYTIDASFTNVNPALAGQLAAMKWSGGPIGGTGKLELTGYTDADLGKSAKGTIHFDWQHGAIAGAGVPPALARFDRWNGDAAIADGRLTLNPSDAQHGGRKMPVKAAVVFGSPAKFEFQPAAKVVPASAAR
jgi:hypothetical protein